MQKRSAFSLVEMLIAVSIISILATLTVPRFLKARCKAETDKTVGMVQAMKNKIDSCIMLTSRLPYVCTTPTACVPTTGVYVAGKFLDCFGDPGSEFNAKLTVAPAQMKYVGGKDGNPTPLCNYDPDNPSVASAAGACTAIYFLYTTQESCFKGYKIFADATTHSARLTASANCP